MRKTERTLAPLETEAERWAWILELERVDSVLWG